MEAPEEVAMASKDHNNIIKGKRTKRLRPQSPIPFAITSQNSIYNNDHDHDDHGHVGKLIPNISPSSSSEYQDNTEEEEDMANCLILLAQGQSRESAKQEVDHDIGIYSKFTSRKFMEAATNGTTKAGYYVYECKTCNRTFPSFQALGGHRASHKKPKVVVGVAAMVEQKIRQFTAAAAAATTTTATVSSSDEEEGQFIKTNNLSSLSLQFGNNSNQRGNLYSNNNVINKAKVHECSICGAEFTSGQALGGHMRRHRGPVGGNTSTSATAVAANTALSLTVPMSMEADNFHRQPKKNVLSLDLDLNLPAPEEDHRESKFPFASKQEQQQQQQKQQQQQSALVFSAAPTLVGCHY